MGRDDASATFEVDFKNHAGTRLRREAVLRDPHLAAFTGEDGTEGFESLLGLVADALDMDLVLLGHVDGGKYTAVASYPRREGFTFPKGGVIPIDETYCREEITARAPFAIGDAELDPMYRDHPGFTKMGLRAYVGVPVMLEDGTLFGTLCGVDTQPRTIGPQMVQRLMLLSGLVSGEVSRRLGLKPESEPERALRRANEHLREYVAGLANTAVERAESVRHLSTSLRDALAAQDEALGRLRGVHGEFRDFAYTVAHDVSEPLRRAGTLLELVAGSDGEDAAQARDRALAEVQHARTRVRALQAFAELVRDENPQPVDFAEVAREVAGRVQKPLSGAGFDVTVNVAAGLPPIRGHRARVAQLLDLLVDNAVRYNPDGARVEVGAENGPDGPEFWVQDDGVGVPEEHRETVFQVFHRGALPPDPAAAGMGLTLVRRIAEGRGGRAWLEPTPGGGLTVRFTLGPATAPGATR